MVMGGITFKAARGPHVTSSSVGILVVELSATRLPWQKACVVVWGWLRQSNGKGHGWRIGGKGKKKKIGKKREGAERGDDL